MNEPPTTEEFLKVLQRRNQALETVLNPTNESYALEPLPGPEKICYELMAEPPIPFAIHGGRDPGPEDLEDGKCWCYEAAQIDICPDCYTVHGTGEGAWIFCVPIADYADRWLPAHVRYLPARVEL